MFDLYEYIDIWNDQQKILYIVIYIGILWLFLKTDSSVNIVLALITGTIIVTYLRHKTKETETMINEHIKYKLENIHPTLNDNSKTAIPIIHFLFSIQDFYAYCPPQYEDMINNINIFYDKYNQSFIDPKTSHINYDLMKKNKRNALNSLFAIDHSLPVNIHIQKKISIAINTLDTILTNDLQKIGQLINKDIRESGYTTDTKIIDNGAKPYNEYGDIFGKHTYEFY